MFFLPALLLGIPTPLVTTFALRIDARTGQPSDRAIKSDQLVAKQGFRRSWFRFNEPLLSTGTSLAELPVFSDDFVPVERMISSLLLTREGR
ncbi:MAG: hypothetical protein ACI9LO_002573 [Planctomycetota bacterium]|jgi:hypothetical protein